MNFWFQVANVWWILLVCLDGLDDWWRRKDRWSGCHCVGGRWWCRWNWSFHCNDTNGPARVDVKTNISYRSFRWRPKSKNWSELWGKLRTWRTSISCPLTSSLWYAAGYSLRNVFMSIFVGTIVHNFTYSSREEPSRRWLGAAASWEWAPCWLWSTDECWPCRAHSEADCSWPRLMPSPSFLFPNEKSAEKLS